MDQSQQDILVIEASVVTDVAIISAHPPMGPAIQYNSKALNTIRLFQLNDWNGISGKIIIKYQQLTMATNWQC